MRHSVSIPLTTLAERQEKLPKKWLCPQKRGMGLGNLQKILLHLGMRLRNLDRLRKLLEELKRKTREIWLKLVCPNPLLLEVRPLLQTKTVWLPYQKQTSKPSTTALILRAFKLLWTQVMLPMKPYSISLGLKLWQSLKHLRQKQNCVCRV